MKSLRLNGPATLPRARTCNRERFGPLFEENRNYGFRRSLWGMKPLGLSITILDTLAVET